MFNLRHFDGKRFFHINDLEIPLQAFENCKSNHTGSVFLLASGSSVKTFPVSRYADYPFIAMNGSVIRLIEEKIRPLFYLCTDKSFPADRPDLAVLGCEFAQHLAMSMECFYEIFLHDESVLMNKSLYLLERVNRYYEKQPVSDRSFAWSIRKSTELVGSFSFLFRKPNRVGFSKNIHYGYFCARTIPYVALQLAYTLGFQKVFILGMDLDEDVGRFYEDKGKALPSSLDKNFDKLILPAFQLVSKKIVHKGFRVFNLSPNSRLPNKVIPKITLDELDQLLEGDA